MRLALVHGVDRGADQAQGDHGSDAAIDAPLHAALSARGIDFARPRWNDPRVDWTEYDLAVVRTVWDYTAARDAFVDWAVHAGTVTRVENPPDVLRWNTHKQYLLELEERGAPVVPTAWLARDDRVDLAALCATRDWTDVIIKPAVGADAEGLFRAHGGPIGLARAQDEFDRLLAAGDVMVQPFRTRIGEGELSLVAIDGRVTHAVRKTPAHGEFRVQGRFGGRSTFERASSDAVRLAEWVLETLGTPLLFARVDLLVADDGTLEIGEVEATEPDLYLEQSEEGTRALVDAIVARLERAGTAGR